MNRIQHFSPFRCLLLLWTCLLYLWGLRLGEIIRDQISNDHIFLFTFLMALHCGIYCLGVFLPSQKRVRLIYYLIQGGLILVLSVVSHSISVTIGLYLGLTGDLMGLLQHQWRVIGAVLGALLLLSGNIAFLYGWSSLRILVLVILPLFFLILGYTLLFIRQAQAHKQGQALLQALEVAHTRQAEYTVRIEELTRIAERRRMARELHDTLAQGLAGLILQLEATKSHLIDHHYERSLEIVEHAMLRARAALTDARCAIDNLRTETLNPANLEHTIQEEIHHFTLATGITCETHIPPLATVPADLCEYVQRMINEGLTNVARHAQAHQVCIELKREHNLLCIEINDDGIGFDPTRVAQQSGHYGLLGLRERARLAHGEFTIRSKPGTGTTMRLVLPETRKENCNELEYNR